MVKNHDVLKTRGNIFVDNMNMIYIENENITYFFRSILPDG